LIETFLNCNTMLTKVKDKWAADFKNLFDLTMELIPSWKSEEAKLADIPFPPIVKELLSNNYFQRLADSAALLNTMALAAKAHSGIFLVPRTHVQSATDTATLASQTVSATFVLFHLPAASKRLKGQSWFRRLRPA
jgi:hypothetical protein